MTIRVLTESDRTVLDAFLSTHRDSSMFLRSNLSRSGLDYRPERFHANYMAAFRDDRCIAVGAHCWNGMLLLQAPESVEELSRACVEHSERHVTGFSGPLDQVRRARSALGLTSVRAVMDSDESLYALDLMDLIVPLALSHGSITWRAPLAGERDLLCAWRAAYEIETLGATDSREMREHAAQSMDQQIADRNVWVAIQKGEPVSVSAFNAALPDIVQLGGIYTPPEFRGRGYAKVAVAGSLIAARERGVTRAVLFTDSPSAIRSYEGVGFQRVGAFGLILLEPITAG
jgi:GNAT superfamily N-acetyltransferase